MFEDLKNYREVGDFDVLSPTLNEDGLFDAALFQQALDSRIEAGSRHLGLEIQDAQWLNQAVMEVIWFFLQKSERQYPGAFAVLAPESLREIFKAFLPLGGFVFFATETQMISWSMQHHEEKPEMELPTPPMTLHVESVQIPESKPQPSAAKKPLGLWILIGMLLLGLALIVGLSH